MLPPENAPLDDVFSWYTWKFSELRPYFEKRGERGMRYLLDKLNSDKYIDRQRAALLLAKPGDNTYLDELAKAYDRDAEKESWNSYSKALNHIGTLEAAKLMASRMIDPDAPKRASGTIVSYLRDLGYPEVIGEVEIFLRSLKGEGSESADNCRKLAQRTLRSLKGGISEGGIVKPGTTYDSLGRTTQPEATSAADAPSKSNPILWLSSIVGVCAIVGIAVVLLRSRLV